MRNYNLKGIYVATVLAGAILLPGLIHAQVPQPDSSETVWDGVFSEDQATRGKASYDSSCSSCHRPDLGAFEGALKGQTFMDRWREDTLEPLYSNISKSMPRNNPGSLDKSTYVDIIAYILQEHGFPSGASDLKSDTLKNIQITAKEGPEPLPTGALVQAFGCIKEDPINTWVLMNATPALRTRNPEKSSDTDLKASEAKLPGTANYRLVDVAFYHPERYKDRMAEAKGFLVADPHDGISVTSLTPLSKACP